MLALNLFIALAGYYIIKTVREPLIAESGGAEWKTYSSAAQAIVMALFYIPFYGWISKKVSRITLNYVLIFFFLISTELFWLMAQFKVPNLGIYFYIWVGLFSLSIVSQFWSYSSDLFSKKTGERLFPVIAIGATLGSPVGSKIAALLFEAEVDPYSMLHITAGLLILHGVLYSIIQARIAKRQPEIDGIKNAEKTGASSIWKEFTSAFSGFELIFKNRYLIWISLLLVILNLVNTTGEYILFSYVLEAAADQTTMESKSFIGKFYGDFFFYVNIATFLIQVLLVSRLVKYLGLRGVLFILPIVAFGTYAMVFAGASFLIFRIGKSAENSVDYSIMNTAKAILWLGTTSEEKFTAKQTIDTLFVRLGDVLAAGFVFLGSKDFANYVQNTLTIDHNGFLHWTPQTFGAMNLVFIAMWIFVAWRVYLGYQESTEKNKLAKNI